MGSVTLGPSPLARPYYHYLRESGEGSRLQVREGFSHQVTDAGCPCHEGMHLLPLSSDIVFQLQPIPPLVDSPHRPPSRGVDFKSFFGRFRVDFDSNFRVDFESRLEIDSTTTEKRLEIEGGSGGLMSREDGL